MADGSLTFTVNDVSPSTGSFKVSGLPDVNNFVGSSTGGAFFQFSSGALKGQAHRCISYAGATTKLATFEEPYTSAPADGDTGIVIGMSE
jgi:hypothetical protein